MCTMEPCGRETYRNEVRVELSKLAAPAEEQSAHLREIRGDTVGFGEESLTDELALDFENVAAQAKWRCDDGQISETERDVLLRIDVMFDAFSGPNNASLWTVGALSSANVWQEIRDVAAEGLKLFEAGE